MKIKMLTICLLLVAVAGFAQERRRVRVGGGGNPEETRDWPKAAAKPNMTDAEVVKALGELLGELSKRDLFSGTVLLAKNGQPLFQQSYGFADREASIKNTNDTKYNLGSINKVFTSHALIQLRDAGKIDFDQPLRRYLPDYPNPLADKVTIQQIINHSSGMGDIFGPKFDAMPKERLRTLQDHLPLFVDEPLQFEPGTSRRYSNAGYIVLGLVIEKVSGMSYYDYVRKHIFEPAGMKDTDSYFSDAKVAKRAVGYTKRGAEGDVAERRPNTLMHGARGSSAGGGYSTAPDMLRFVNALLAGKIISRPSLAKLAQTPPDAPADAPVRLATGWGGGAPGINAMVEVEGEWVLIVMSNYDPPAAQYVARNWRALTGRGDED